MVTCEECGVALVDGRKCSYCDGTYCQDHRLPERHDCRGMRHSEMEGKRFGSGFGGGDETDADG